MNKVQANKTKCTFRDCESRLSQEKCECQRTKMNNNLSYPPLLTTSALGGLPGADHAPLGGTFLSNLHPHTRIHFFPDRFTITFLLSRTYFTQEFNILHTSILYHLAGKRPFLQHQVVLDECQPKAFTYFQTRDLELKPSFEFSGQKR